MFLTSLIFYLDIIILFINCFRYKKRIEIKQPKRKKTRNRIHFIYRDLDKTKPRPKSGLMSATPWLKQGVSAANIR